MTVTDPRSRPSRRPKRRRSSRPVPPRRGTPGWVYVLVAAMAIVVIALVVLALKFA